jgi:hypothetical protein
VGSNPSSIIAPSSILQSTIRQSVLYTHACKMSSDKEITTAKDQPDHIEQGLEKLDRDRPQLKSGFDELSVWQTVKQFKYATLVCIAVCFAGSADGYQVSTSGICIDKSTADHHRSGSSMVPSSPTQASLISLAQMVSSLRLSQPHGRPSSQVGR